MVGVGVVGLLGLAVIWVQYLMGKNDQQTAGPVSPPLSKMDKSGAEKAEQEELKRLRQQLEEERRKLEELRAAEEQRRQEEEQRRQREEAERRRQEEEERAAEEALREAALRQQIGAATFQAWRQLQAIETQTHNTTGDILRGKKQFPSEIFGSLASIWRGAASAYAQIDLTDVDPDLIAHVKQLIALYKEGASLFQELAVKIAEAEQVLQASVDLAKEASRYPEQQGSDAMALLGVIGAIGSVAGIDKIQKDFKPKVDDWWDRYHRQNNLEKALAQKLTERYGTTFIDAF
jgi:TolA-binding protein